LAPAQRVEARLLPELRGPVEPARPAALLPAERQGQVEQQRVERLLPVEA
jgi:hypothetical protein